MVSPQTARPGGRPGWNGHDPIDEYLEFRRELRSALRECTPAALRAVLRRWAGPRDPKLGPLMSQPDAMLEPIIRRMILEEPQLADMHEAARRWLIQHEPAEVRHRHVVPTDQRRQPRRVQI